MVLALDIALHVGTLLAVLFVFRHDLWRMVTEKEGMRLAFLLGIATLPAVVVGLGFKHQIEELFVSPKVAAVGLLITGTLLWWTRRISRHERGEKEVTVPSALLVGVAQAIAITPGISRSGSTIAAGLFCHFDQVFAARFSFLMSIPAILGSVVLEGKNLANLRGDFLMPVIAGTVVSAIAGFLGIKILMRLMSHGRLHYFAYYCWIIGIVSLIVV